MQIVDIFKKLVLISRPRFWSYLYGPFIVGFAGGLNTSMEMMSAQFVYGLFYFLLPANIILYGINDLFDRSTDKLNAKKGQFENLLSDNQTRFYISSILISFILGLPLILILNKEALIIFILFILLSIFYSAPPLRFKARPILDFLSNILYVLPGILAYAQITAGQIPDAQIIISSWLWVSAMHLFSAIPDIKADRSAGIKTSAVLMGKKASLALCFLMWFGVFVFINSYSIFFLLTLLYPFITALVYMGKLDLEKTYWRFSSLNLILGFLLFWYVILK